MKVNYVHAAAVSVLSIALLMGNPSIQKTSAKQPEQSVLIFYKNMKGKAAALQKHIKIKHQFKTMPVLSASADSSTVSELKNNPDITSVEKNVTFHLADQSYASEKAIHASAGSLPTEDSWWDAQTIQSPMMWKKGFTGRGIKVAVIDSGIAPHPDLSVKGGISTVDYTSSYMDDNGHGTHVAGIIGAKLNGYGIAGTAPDADLYAVKAMDNKGIGTLESLLKAIDWSIQNHMDILNMSLGTPDDSPLLHQAVDRAYKKGILIVSAAGNEGNADGTGNTMGYPALYSSSISVGAIDQGLKRAGFSSTGPLLELSAPGVNIPSTYLNNQYAYMSGTSQAAPHVTGMLADLKQQYPDKSAQELRNLLISTAIDLGALGRDPLYGYGLSRFLDIPAKTLQKTAPKNVQDLISTAKKSLSQADIEAAQKAVNQLPKGSEKTALQYQINFIKFLQLHNEKHYRFVR